MRLKTGEPVLVKFIFISKAGPMFHGIGIDDKMEYRNILASECKQFRRKKV